VVKVVNVHDVPVTISAGTEMEHASRYISPEYSPDVSMASALRRTLVTVPDAATTPKQDKATAESNAVRNPLSIFASLWHSLPLSARLLTWEVDRTLAAGQPSHGNFTWIAERDRLLQVSLRLAHSVEGESMRARSAGAFAVVLFLALVLIPVSGMGQSPFPLVRTYQIGASNYESQISAVTFYPADGRYLILSRQDYGGFSVVDTQSWTVVASVADVFANWISFNGAWSLAALYPGVFETGTWHRVWGFDSLNGLLNSVTWQPFSPDGTLLACPGMPITTWNVKAGTLVQKFYLPKETTPLALAFIQSATKLLAVWNDGGKLKLALWETETGTSLPSIGSPVIEYPEWATFSPDGSLLAVSQGGLMRIFSREVAIVVVDVASGSTVAGFSAEAGGEIRPGVAFINGNRFLVSGGKDTVSILTIPGGRQVATFQGDPAGLTAFGVSSDGRLLAVGGLTGRVDIWDISALNAYACSGLTISKVDWAKGCVTIKNTTSGPLDLIGWRISDGDRSSTFEASVPVAAGGTYVACQAVYNPSKSSRGLTIDTSDEQVVLYSPEICGGTKESTKRQ
jgi:WD40 repeat protein